MLGIPSPPAHGGSWAVSKSTTVFFWYPFFQMKSFTAFCSVLIILILPYTVRHTLAYSGILWHTLAYSGILW